MSEAKVSRVVVVVVVVVVGGHFLEEVKKEKVVVFSSRKGGGEKVPKLIFEEVGARAAAREQTPSIRQRPTHTHKYWERRIFLISSKEEEDLHILSAAGDLWRSAFLDIGIANRDSRKKKVPRRNKSRGEIERSQSAFTALHKK